MYDGRPEAQGGRRMTEEAMALTPSALRPILILGLGNPLQGDDGVGCRAIEALQRMALPETVEAVDAGTPGVGLIHLLEGRERAILVDAAEMGAQPGAVIRFRPEEVTLTGSAERFSLHRSAVSDALALARALALPLPEIVFFGVQPASVGWETALSPAVDAALPGLIDAILNEITGSAQEVPMPTKSDTDRAAGLILIIDDDPDMAEALRMILEANGYAVAHAGSGRVGLNMVRELTPDLIILDVMMETATEGFQVSLALRSPDADSPYAAYSRIPILMLTSIHATTPLRFGPEQDYLPVDAFIDKPIDPDKLIAQVAALLAKR